MALLLASLLLGSLPPRAAGEPTLWVQTEQPAPQIVVPAGFVATQIARLPENRQPTSIAYGPDGALYIAVLAGEIYRLSAGGVLTQFAGPYQFPLGLAWRGDELYFTSLTNRGERSAPAGGQCGNESQRGRVGILRDADGDGRAEPPRFIIPDLPVGLSARHLINGIAFGPDDKLYITNGSCENRRKTTDDPRRGTIQRYNPDGTIPADNPDPRSPVIATGMRNPYDIAIHPVDGTVFTTENGRDDMGDDLPPEELNQVIFAPGTPPRAYGWPECFGNGRGSECDGTQAPVAELEPHASANGITFYSGGQFGPEYRQNAFIAYYGAGNPQRRPYGRKVARVELTRAGAGYSARVSVFATGFERPLDVLTASNGGLLVADFGQINAGTGAIYRIDRLASASPFVRVPAPSGAEAPAYVPETGHSLAEDFADAWRAGGGPAVLGYPISQELIEDGVIVQYFERARLERHIAERRPELRVRLALLGRAAAAGREAERPFLPLAPQPDSPERRYFPETGHSLAGGFRAYWEAGGGVGLFGLPISEEFSERDAESGRERTVQYFERARFEHHPESPGAEVQLARLGAALAASRYGPPPVATGLRGGGWPAYTLDR